MLKKHKEEIERTRTNIEKTKLVREYAIEKQYKDRIAKAKGAGNAKMRKKFKQEKDDLIEDLEDEISDETDEVNSKETLYKDQFSNDKSRYEK